MQAYVLGCGEAFDNDLFNTSILVRTGSAALLLDCGYSIPPRVWQTSGDANEIDLVYISHQHADHFFGLPALLGRMWEDGRTKPLTILSQPAVLDAARAAMELGYRGLAARFQYSIAFEAAEPGKTVEACGARFTFAETRHAVPNLAVRIEAGDNSVCYSGDGMFLDGSRRLYRDADLLIHEAYSFEPTPVHADIGAVLEVAQSECVPQVALVHVQRAVRRNLPPIAEAVEKAAGTLASMPEPGATLHC